MGWFYKDGQQPQWIADSKPKVKTNKEQLEEAVEKEDYERAAVLRDRIKSIETGTYQVSGTEREGTEHFKTPLKPHLNTLTINVV